MKGNSSNSQCQGQNNKCNSKKATKMWWRSLLPCTCQIGERERERLVDDYEVGSKCGDHPFYWTHFKLARHAWRWPEQDSRILASVSIYIAMIQCDIGTEISHIYIQNDYINNYYDIPMDKIKKYLTYNKSFNNSN